MFSWVHCYKFYFLYQLKSRFYFSASQLQCSEAELLSTYTHRHTEGLLACYLMGFRCKQCCIVEKFSRN